MAGRSILISCTDEYEKFAIGLSKLLEVDFVHSVIDLDGSNDLSQVVLVVSVLTEGYRRKLQLQAAKEKKIPVIFARFNDYLPDTYYVQLASETGKSVYHYFDHIDPLAGIFNSGKFLSDVHATIHEKSEARKNFKKRILLIGESGVGKSAIASLLINGCVHNGINPGDILVSPQLVSGTLIAKSHENDDYIITDTIGFGLPDEFGEDGSMAAIYDLYKILSHSRIGYHAIFFLIQDKRILDDTRRTFDMYFDTIFPDMASYFRVVYTRSEFIMDYLERYPDPLNRNVKGVCTGLRMSAEKQRLATSETTLSVLKQFIQNETPAIPAVPELAWVSKNSFYNTLKGLSVKLNMPTLFTDKVEKLAKEYDAVLKFK